MVLLCYIQYAHAAVVGTYIVERLYPFGGIAHFLGQVQTTCVQLQSFVKAALVAHGLSLLSQSCQAVGNAFIGGLCFIAVPARRHCQAQYGGTQNGLECVLGAGQHGL